MRVRCAFGEGNVRRQTRTSVVRVFIAVFGVVCALRGRLASALNRTDISAAVNACNDAAVNAASAGSPYDWGDCKDSIGFEIANWNVADVEDFSLLFDGMTTFDADISKWDMATATNLRGMFIGCTSFNADISSWDTKNVVDMSHMFEGASQFNEDISAWNTHAVTDMSHMFEGATLFNANIKN